jgi:hypothetical protein
LIRRQVSKASMPGMAASSRIRSGITSASRPGTAQFDEAEGQPLLRRLRPEHAHDLVEEFPPRQFVRVEPHLAGLDARDVEQAIDQAQQGVAAAPGSRRPHRAGARAWRRRPARSAPARNLQQGAVP